MKQAVEREIFRIEGPKDAATLVFFGGIHGNEPSGVFALRKVFEKIQSENIPIKANVIALAGNLWALDRGERFHQKDLNRLWTKDRMNALENGSFVPENEDEKQQLEIYQALQKIFNHQSKPFYFFDLHTTSGKTIPFITVNDSLLNRKFTEQYPVPKILGIEEYLEGPLLSYINELGYVSFGFEGGQHNEQAAIDHHEAFIFMSLIYTGAIERKTFDFQHYEKVLKQTFHHNFEIFFRHEIQPDETFLMEHGFQNFQKIRKGELLAKNNHQPIFASQSAQIFMPLYQSQGNDGFFLIRPIPMIFLQLSAFLRKTGVDRWMKYLPGVKSHPSEKETLLVNRKIARFFTKPILHLLGYRSKNITDKYLEIRSREYHSKWEDYK